MTESDIVKELSEIRKNVIERIKDNPLFIRRLEQIKDEAEREKLKSVQKTIMMLVDATINDITVKAIFPREFIAEFIYKLQTQIFMHLTPISSDYNEKLLFVNTIVYPIEALMSLSERGIGLKTMEKIVQIKQNISGMPEMGKL